MKLAPRSSMLACAVAGLLLSAGPVSAEPADEVRKNAFDRLARGVAAYKRGEYTKAIEELTYSANRALNNFRAHYYLGLALIADRQYEESLFPLEIALDLDPTHLMARVALGDARLRLGDTGESMAEYFRALELRPEFAPALDGIARTYEATADSAKAIEFFERAIASDRGYAEAYTHLGDLHLRQGQVSEAVRLLAEAVSIRPDYAPGLNRLALAYNRLGMANEAVAAIRSAIELEPKSASHRATLGRIQLELGLTSTAEATLHEALELDPAFPDTRSGLAEIARRDGDYEAAAAHIELALADPRLDALQAGALRGELERIGLEQARQAELQAKVDADEATPAEQRELAAVYASRGRWDLAVALQRGGVESDADRERLAFLLFRSGRFRKAQQLYGELAATHRRADLDVNEGVALSRLGDDAAAAAAFRRALELEARNPQALLYLGNALMRLGERDGAVSTYRRFMELGGDGEAEERVRRILVLLGAITEPPPTEPLNGPALTTRTPETAS